MKSLAVSKEFQLEFIDIPRPECDESSVLVKILACGICGTDMKIIHGRFKPCKDYPCLLGHEAVGIVVEVGKDVEAFEVGDKVLLPYIDGKVGEYQTFFGAFSEYGICHDWRAMAKNGKGPDSPGFNDFFFTQKKIPAHYDPVASVMIITLREVLGAVKHFGFCAKDNLVIFGGGSVGLAFAKFAKLIGMGPVILVDVLDEKVERAKKIGVDYAFNSRKTDIVSEIRKIFPEGVDYTLDAVGVNALIPLSMQLIKMGGKILIYGIDPNLNMDLDWTKAPNNWALEFFWSPEKEVEAEVHDQLIRWIDMGLIDPADFVSHVFDFDDAMKGFDILENHLPADKIVIKIGEE